MSNDARQDRPKYNAGKPPLRKGGGKPAWAARRSGGSPGPAQSNAAADDADATPRIFGMHAAAAALDNPRRVITRVYLTENAENKLKAALERRQITAERVSPRELDRRLGADTVHQGALIETEELPDPDLADLARAATGGRPLLVLDQVTDPHNVGAILRSAAVFDAVGLVMTRRHSPALSGVLAKAASGALELVPIMRVQNLARGLAQLQDAGFTVIGLDGEASDTIEAMQWPQCPALLLGAEGKGLRQLSRETCDRLVRISTEGPLASLNVSNAAAVVLHEAASARRRKAKA